MTNEIKQFIAAYAKSLDITQAEAEEKILHTGCVRINALRKYANAQKKLASPKAPRAKKAAKGPIARKAKAPKASKPKAAPVASAPTVTADDI